MAASKNILESVGSILRVVITVLLLAPVAFSIDLEWKSMTSFKDVRRMKLINDTLYMATSGGLLINDFNNTNSSGQELTNTEGIGTVDITDFIIDAAGQKWVTGLGRLLRFDYSHIEPFLFFDQDNNLIKLHTVADDGNFLWVGTETGLVLFSKIIDGGQIQDSYTLFDSLNPSPSVFDIYLNGDTIWIATSSGLAMANKSDPVQLKAPSFWKTYDRGRYAELASDTITRVVGFENTIYTATTRGLYRLTRAATDTFVIIPFGQNSPFTDLKVENDSLFFFSTGATGAVKDSVAASISTAGLPARPATGATNGSFRWANVRNIGIYQNSSGSYQAYPYSGLPGNNVTDVSLNKEGVITAGFYDRGGGQLVNGQWNTFNLGQPSTLVSADPSGDAWVGTFGYGLWRAGDGVYTNYDETNSTLRGNNDLPNGSSYVVIYGIKTDSRFIYVASYRALNIYPISIGALNNLNSLSGWDSLGIAQGIKNEFVSSLDVIGQHLAVGTEGIGLYECDLGPDPSNTSDDRCILYDQNNAFLPSNTIRTVKYSPKGDLWVGTNFGLSRYDFGIERFVDVPLPAGIGPDIRALEFDTRGNLWIGAKNGVARFEIADSTTQIYNTLNSGLVSNNVNNINYDEFTGRVYVATDAGISMVSSTFGHPTPDVLSVVAFPNPFIIDSPDDALEFNYSKSGVIRLYSMAGDLVREFQVGERWDGRNDKGDKVASGVYLFVLTDDVGKVGRGKILLIRK